MKILLFGGTTEGRILAEKLASAGHSVTGSTATKAGEKELAGIPCKIIVGRLSSAEMEERMKGFDIVVDATHPYAAEVSRNIRNACREAGIPVKRVLREASDYHGGEAILVDDAEEAARWLDVHEGNVLLTTGSKELGAFSSLNSRRLYPRVLPTHEALIACESLGIPEKNIVAMQGPFSTGLNAELIRQFHICYLVTKDGGAAGGFKEKQEAARLTGIVLIVIRRPADSGTTMEELLAELEKQQEGDR